MMVGFDLYYFCQFAPRKTRYAELETTHSVT